MSSCSHFVQKIQADIQRQKAAAGTSGNQSPPLYNNAMKQKTTKFDERKINDPLTFTAYGDEHLSKNSRNLNTRKTRNDFIDSGNGGSLWGSYDSSTSFFTNAMTIRESDIIVVEVLEDMKKSITRELRKAYPPPVS